MLDWRSGLPSVAYHFPFFSRDDRCEELWATLNRFVTLQPSYFEATVLLALISKGCLHGGIGEEA